MVDTESKQPLNNQESRLRKILMFLMLNTDASYKYNLRDDNNFIHVYEICPLLPKFMLVTIVWDLHLDSFFYEMLSYSPCWFSFQYFEPATDSLKYIEDAFEVLEKVQQLLKSIFISISRSELRKMDNVDSKIIYNKLYDYAMNLLRQFYTPDAEKFKKFTKNKFYKYSGFALKYLLELLLYCFDVFECGYGKTNPLQQWQEYDLCSALCNKLEKDFKPETKLLKEHQLKIITALLNALQNNVMAVNIDIFIYWVEIDLNDKTLQEIIGTMAYELMEKMQNNKALGHDVQQQLQAIAIRPKTFTEIVRDATIGDILNALDDTKLEFHIKKAWLDELFGRNAALGNEECWQSIRQHTKYMCAEHCCQILDFLHLEITRIATEQRQEMDVEAATVDLKSIEPMELDEIMEDYEDLVKLIVLAMQEFSTTQIISVLNYQCKLFGFSSTLFATADITARLTEFLNKYNSDASSFDFRQFLILSFENANLAWQRFFDIACHGLCHISKYCACVKEARPLSNNYFMPQLLDAFKDLTVLQQRHFPLLLCEIYFTLYYPDRKTDFLKQIIHKHVNAFLESQQFEHILPLVKCLNLINTYGESQSHKPLNFDEITAPVLLMAAQIMEKSRWDLINFTDVRDEIVQGCIQFIQHTSKKFLPNATEKGNIFFILTFKNAAHRRSHLRAIVV